MILNRTLQRAMGRKSQTLDAFGFFAINVMSVLLICQRSFPLLKKTKTASNIAFPVVGDAVLKKPAV